MAITRLKRKGRRNKQKSSIRRATIKQITATPVIKNVDIEEIKKGFEETAAAKPAKKEAKPKAEAPVAEVEVKEEKKEKATKKPAAKKETKEKAPKKA